jgi:hypothetical protein
MAERQEGFVGPDPLIREKLVRDGILDERGSRGEENGFDIILRYEKLWKNLKRRPSMIEVALQGDVHPRVYLRSFGSWYAMHQEMEKRLGYRVIQLFFVTLRKSPKDYSPSTLYRDYAVSETLFHWQSQNRTTPETATGQRYIHHQKMGGTLLLFVRTEEKGADMPLGLSSPYIFLGPVRYVSHEGSRPMSILWHLDHPMPPALFEVGAAAVG